MKTIYDTLLSFQIRSDKGNQQQLILRIRIISVFPKTDQKSTKLHSNQSQLTDQEPNYKQKSRPLSGKCTSQEIRKYWFSISGTKNKGCKTDVKRK